MTAKSQRARSTAQAPSPKTAPRPRASGKTQELPDDRRQVLISEAARLFGSKGYENTSMRDIAAVVGILPGSLYYHFPSKEDLFVAVYSFAVSQSLDAVKQAVEGRDDAWARLEAACIAHMHGLLDKNRFASVLVSHLAVDTLPEQVVTLRDKYEAVFKDLVAELPLPAGVDQRIFRLGLLGSMNWAITWYRPGVETPASIARKLLNVIRRA
ncbi:TetR/AcrR family transcriptional regulator [Bradyrhizobium sp. Pear76]|uniref:TetR/AcrR family transcriptional regulator n=1 Tax=Bradyrhizobium oropedii TaxID=1571201 RepID=UPI00237BBF05|nr:TetR/AcrR family transcriptional regulator [Bradyrhizobium oropedii]MCC8962359.1 TetR/AcrR family transcriptional regulator [Bradyrhizobium oropedii]